LQLYAYAKIAEGKDFAAAEKPGMFNLAVRIPRARRALVPPQTHNTHIC
jgi:hypothetical protein